MTDMLVSGAGAAEFNGIYYEKDIENGKPYYAKGDHKIWWTSQGKWSIDLDTSYGYAGYSSTDNQPTPDLCRAWVAELAIPPAPTVTLINEPEPAEYTLICDSGSYSITGNDVEIVSSVPPPPSAGHITYPIIRMTIDEDSLTYREEQVIHAEVLQEINPLSIEIPASNATITLRLDGQLVEDFSPFSDGRYYNSLYQGLVVDISEQIDEREVFVGRFYLDEWENTTRGELTFKCVDAIGLLDKLPFDGAFYALPRPLPVILDNIFNPIGIGYELESFSGVFYIGFHFSGYLPGNITVREALQQVLFAVGAYATCEGSAKVLIKEAIMPIKRTSIEAFRYDDNSTRYDDDVSRWVDVVADKVVQQEEKADKDALTILPLVTSIELLSHDYVQSSQVETIFEAANLAAGDYKIIFPKPYWDIVASGVGDSIVYLACDDGAILTAADSPTNVWPDVIAFTTDGEFEFGSNYVYLHVITPGAVLVTGKPWIDTVQEHRYKIGFEESSLAKENIWRIDKATMVNKTNAAQVLSRLVDYSTLRYKQVSLLFPNEIELGNVVVANSFYEREIVGLAKRVRKNLTGGYLMELEFIGIERIGG